MKILKNFPRSSIFSLKKPLRYSPPFMVADHSKKKKEKKNYKDFVLNHERPLLHNLSFFFLSLSHLLSLFLGCLPSLHMPMPPQLHLTSHQGPSKPSSFLLLVVVRCFVFFIFS